jgi:O-antigen/teichoic acid export membrane protein
LNFQKTPDPQPDANVNKRPFAWRQIGVSSIWMIAAAAFALVSQYTIVLLVARRSGTIGLGEFSLAQAYVICVSYVGWLALRNQYLVDHTGDYDFSDYLFLRAVFPFFLYATATLVLVFVYWGSQTAIIAASLFALKFSEGFSDINAAFFQKEHLSHFITASALLRLIACLAVFVPIYTMSHSLQFGLLALAAVWLVFFQLFDNRFRRHVMPLTQNVLDLDINTVSRRWSLFKITFPLGCSSAVMILMNYLPRLGLNAFSGLQELGLFSAIQYFLTFGAMFMAIVSQAMLPTLSKCVVENKLLTFAVLVGAFMFIVGLGCVCTWLLAYYIGDQALTLIYGPQFRNLQPLFEGSIPTMFFVFSGIIMAAGATAFHLYRTIFVTYMTATIVVAAMTWLLVPKFAALGAFYALGLGALTQTVILGLAITTTAIQRKAPHGWHKW